MSGLPREILKWMQSLDLSYSIKNVRRDFSNGFLCAEIFSRYYKQDLQMHSFDNGASQPKKKDNWAQLLKFFNKMGFPISAQSVEDVLVCKQGAAVELIQNIYTILTQKTVQAPRSLVDDESSLPPFARPTASQLVKDGFKSGGIIEPKAADLHATVQKAQAIIEEHNRSTRKEKLNDPSRYQPLHNSSSKIIRVPTRTVESAEVTAPQMQFVKQVNVKRIDENVAQMRAAKSMAAAAGAAASRSAAQSVSGLSQNGDFPTHSGISSPVASKSVVQLLNAVVLASLDGMDVVKLFDPRQDAVVGFVEAIGQFPDKLAAQVFTDIIDKAIGVCADSCAASPKEFWTFISLFVGSAITRLHHGSEAFQAVIRLVSTVGDKIVARDPYVSFALFSDFALPKVCALLKTGSPPKQSALLRVLYHYALPNPDEHVKVIRKLQKQLGGDLGVFIRSLGTLITLEREFTEELLDLYIYYATTGMQGGGSTASPTVRAAAVAMLPVIAAQPGGHVHVLNLLESILNLLDDTWWEVQAQLLVTCAALLKAIDRSHDKCPLLYDVVQGLLNQQPSSNVLKIGLSALAPVLRLHPSLLPGFTIALLTGSAATETRKALITNAKQEQILAVASSAIGEYRLAPLPSVWYSLGVAQVIAQQVKDNDFKKLGVGAIEVLAAAVTARFQDDEIVFWRRVFDDLREYILVELCEETAADAVASILKRFLLHPSLQADAIQIMTPTQQGLVPPLFGVLMAIFSPDGAVQSQRTAVKLLLDLASVDGVGVSPKSPFYVHLYKLLKNLADKHPPFSGSGLADVLKQLEEKK